ncbi:MAG: hypothetical protein N2D54_10060, partial [Chloroflexota bacterium]
TLVMMAIGLDISLLGIGIAVLDAFDEGHTLKKDMQRSFQATFLPVILFGGQFGLAIGLGIGFNLLTLTLLLAILLTAIGLQTLAPQIQSGLDTLGRLENQAERAELRTAATSLSRLANDINFGNMSEIEFNRLTRRAIGYLGDLPRLASSPLIKLPLIQKRLSQRGARNTTLEQANELKVFLRESIQRLKPDTAEKFGKTDEWRFYNALYFPYIAGIKPSRRRQALGGLSEENALALEWFQTEVPERTLHNWQNAAAKLIAQDIQEQLKS